MTTFPALQPAERRYSFGMFPVTNETGFGGGSVRFLHSNISSTVKLELGFESITQSEAKVLRDHYRNRQSGFLPFALSSEVWDGHTDLSTLAPAITEWVYADEPEETHRSGGLIDMTVQLVSVR